jgi:hypothetical protein
MITLICAYQIVYSEELQKRKLRKQEQTKNKQIIKSPPIIPTKKKEIELQTIKE